MQQKEGIVFLADLSGFNRSAKDLELEERGAYGRFGAPFLVPLYLDTRRGGFVPLLGGGYHGLGDLVQGDCLEFPDEGLPGRGQEFFQGPGEAPAYRTLGVGFGQVGPVEGLRPEEPEDIPQPDFFCRPGQESTPLRAFPGCDAAGLLEGKKQLPDCHGVEAGAEADEPGGLGLPLFQMEQGEDVDGSGKLVVGSHLP